MLRRRPKKTPGQFRLYMNVGYQLSEEVVRRYFQQLCTHGQILDVYIPRHNSGRNKGYGFTTFENEADLLTALQSTDHVIGGNVVKINRAGPRPDYEGNEGDQDDLSLPIYNLVQQTARMQLLQQEPGGGHQAAAHGKGPRLYLGGIPDDVDANHIKSHFSRWGNVVDIYFPGKSGLKRVNYCFVTFDNWQAAQRSCNQSERCIAGRPIQSISLAEERTVDGRDLGYADDLARPSFPEASAEWLQQIRGLQQGGVGGASMAMGDPHQQSYHRMQGPDARMGVGPGAMSSDAGLTWEQLMYKYGKGGSLAAPHQDAYGQQAHYWPPSYHQQQYHTLPARGVPPANVPGVSQEYGHLLRNNAGLNYGSLEALQQAMALHQGHNQGSRAAEQPPVPHWRSDVVEDPFAGRAQAPLRAPESYRGDWQAIASPQRPSPSAPVANLASPSPSTLTGQEFPRTVSHGDPASRPASQPATGDAVPKTTYPLILPPVSGAQQHLDPSNPLGNPSPQQGSNLLDATAASRGRLADPTLPPSGAAPGTGGSFF